MSEPRKEKPSISILLPTMNEEGAIEKVIDDARRATAGWEVEIVIVDSSTDRTAEIARRKNARVIAQPPQGPGKALITGFTHCRGEVIIVADCDNTYPMEDIPRFIAAWQEGGDLVSGNRMRPENKAAMPLLNRLGNHFFAWLVRAAFGIKTSDIASGMRLYTADFVKSCQWQTNYSLWIETIILTKRGGFFYKEFPIKYRTRVGEVKMKPWRTCIAYLLCILKYKLNIEQINSQKIKWI